MKKIIVGGDTHIPFHNPQAVALFIQFLRWFKPDTLVINGDFLDCFQLSKYERSPFLEKETFQEEIKIARTLLKKMASTCKELYLIEGNHEWRLKKYIQQRARELYWLPGLRMERILGLGEKDLIRKAVIKYVACPDNLSDFTHNYINLNGLYIGHFHKVLKNAGYTARILRDELGINLITGHTHRIGLTWRQYIEEQKMGMESGCLCSLEPTYMRNPDWTNGFVVCYQEGENWTCYPIPIINNQFIFQGRVFKGE